MYKMVIDHILHNRIPKKGLSLPRGTKMQDMNAAKTHGTNPWRKVHWSAELWLCLFLAFIGLAGALYLLRFGQEGMVHHIPSMYWPR